MIMPSIAIDIDNTLYSFDTGCREAFFEMAIEYNDKTFLRGAYAPQAEWRSFADVLGEDVLQQVIERVHDKTLHQNPYPGAVNTVNTLFKAGYDIKYVTTRQQRYSKDTFQWLSKNDFPQATNLICSSENKLEHISDCQYLIDDRPKTILDFIYDFNWKNSQADIEGKRLAFGLWFPYNQALTDVRNVLLAPTWRGIQYYLERKDIL